MSWNHQTIGSQISGVPSFWQCASSRFCGTVSGSSRHLRAFAVGARSGCGPYPRRAHVFVSGKKLGMSDSLGLMVIKNGDS